MKLKRIVILFMGVYLAGCIESNSSSSTSDPYTMNQSPPNVVVGQHEEGKKEFKREDKARSREYLDTRPIDNEVSGNNAVIKIKDLISVLPSHLYEGYDEHGGLLEYNSAKFTVEDLSKGVIVKIDPVKPDKLYLNTHIDQRNYSLSQKDSAIKKIVELKMNLLYQKFASISSPAMSLEKKTVLFDACKDFITKVMDDDKKSPNGNVTTARDFFFGENSVFHTLTASNQITSKLIEDNLSVINSGVAKAITYHGDMGSAKGDVFLSSRFPEVDKLITSLYFEPHGKDSPHLTDKSIPDALIRNMENIMNQFVVSSSAFNSDYIKFISSERLGHYIAASPDITQQKTNEELSKIQNQQLNLANRINQSRSTGIGDCNVQAVNLAYMLRNDNVSADIYTLYNNEISHTVVLATMNDGKKYFVDPWAGLIVRQEDYSKFYSEFSNRNLDVNLNALLSSEVVSFSNNMVNTNLRTGLSSSELQDLSTLHSGYNGFSGEYHEEDAFIGYKATSYLSYNQDQVPTSNKFWDGLYVAQLEDTAHGYATDYLDEKGNGIVYIQKVSIASDYKILSDANLGLGHGDIDEKSKSTYLAERLWLNSTSIPITKQLAELNYAGLKIPHSEEEQDMEVILDNSNPRIKMTASKKLTFRNFEKVSEEIITHP